MLNLLTETKDNTLVFSFEGSIDSTNADTTATKVFSFPLNENNVIFDFEKLTYISSAGLRVVLKVAKIAKSFEVINVSSDVYEVFDMTGFSQIVKIKKALRIISIEGKECIGEGYIGKVYRLDDETIIKVFMRHSTIEDVYREAGLAKKAFILGVPTAIPFDVVKVKEGGYGSVFELLKSQCFNKLFIAHPENEEKYIEMYIDLLKKLLNTPVDDVSDLPNKKDEALYWVDFLRKHETFETRILDKLEAMIKAIPDVKNLVHGDYHIKNIMMQGDEPLLIDMDTLGYGHPIFEISAFYLTYLGYPAIDHGNTKDFLGIDYEVGSRIFYNTLNAIYCDRSKEEIDDIVDKLTLFGHMWLTYKTVKYEPENLARLNNSKGEVIRLIDKLETLDF